MVIGTGLALLPVADARADTTPERLASAIGQAQKLKAFIDRLSPAKQIGLSSAAWNLAQSAQSLERVSATNSAGVAHAKAMVASGAAPTAGPSRTNGVYAGPVAVSAREHDVAFSSLGGMTQSETSTAWCGANVVVGYNDSGSLLETQFGLPPRQRSGLSRNGLARSTDGGLTFKDLGFLNPGPNVTDQLGGDPVLACSSATTFHYAAIFVTGDRSAISVSTSVNGGATFGNPVAAASKPLSDPSGAPGHFLDKPWLAVDPGNRNRLYVTYTDFSDPGASETCGFDARAAIELVRSTDGGATWSAPIAVTEVCGFSAFVQGSQVIVNRDGQVYVAWESVTETASEMGISRSTDRGQSFSAPVKVADVKPVGSVTLGLFQGGFRTAQEFPSIAVDRSRGASAGMLYLTWNNGDLAVNDKVADTYHYADIVMTKSADGGRTWSKPARVNRNVEPQANGLGSDQYQPGVAVDPQSGRVAVCYYDRRRDSTNFLIDRFCASSTDTGKTWSEFKVTARSFPAIVAQDQLVSPTYMGDYDALASDTTGANPGFIGAYADNGRGNPNVWAVRF
jgi:hypothetical protein